jgi:hypothetical protein
VLYRRGKDTSDDLAIFGTDVNTAGSLEKRLIELIPQFIAATHEGHIIRVFKV